MQLMTIEDIRNYLQGTEIGKHPSAVNLVIDSIVAIQNDAYNSGYDDAETEALADAQEPIPE